MIKKINTKNVAKLFNNLKSKTVANLLIALAYKNSSIKENNNLSNVNYNYYTFSETNLNRENLNFSFDVDEKYGYIFN